MEDKNNIIYLDGYQIFIKGFTFVETYINGLPKTTETLNTFNQLLVYPDYLIEWGIDIPAVINRNTIQYDSNGLLPKYLYQVWLYSPRSINDPLDRYEGSQIICNWFGDSMEPSISVQQYIIQKLYKFSWLNKAQNIKPFKP
ncbi:MAG: hypothetical protein O9297_03155 [Flavobacterium sp.]|jgi:hypothetical protein|uniref:hypothetical protein n=1 Tax=Flavobacterium sp. TaxID=239 RepID=UPI0022C166FF|nr:hypothetical protein [Flavobacterium sp.]MCZ8296200.1 hypothetical protein [Flavobacterium sp.]